MSSKAARDYIEKAIRSNPEYNNLKKQKNESLMRTAMNSQIHTLNVSYSTFQTNNSKSINKLSTGDLKDLYDIFIKSLTAEVGQGRVFTSLQQAKPIIGKDELLSSASGCILIVSGIDTSIVGINYRAIRELVTRVIKSDYQFMKSPIGAAELGVKSTGEYKSKSILELGHTLTSTPLAETIRTVMAYSDNKKLNSELSIILDDLYNTQASIGYEFLNKSDNNKLGSAVISLVIQPKDVNSQLSAKEGKLYESVLNSIKRNLNLLEVPGSNSLKQDALQFYKDKFVTTLTGKKQANVKKHSPVKGSVKVANSNKTKVATFKNTSLINSTATKSIDLTSLQNLMNKQLQDVISANMGNGIQKDILNYRTGRFASSANVEYLTMSKEGLISAFYSYMKYPYATFSAGGKQQYPKSRDPKLLISRSIREIAEQVVTNRLRAVLV